MAESLYYGIKIISQRSLNDWSYQQRVHPKQGSGKNYEFKKQKYWVSQQSPETLSRDVFLAEHVGRWTVGLDALFHTWKQPRTL